MLTDALSAVLDRVPVDDCERTTQLFLDPWQWPLVDPDDTAIDEAWAALRCHNEPTLPILEAVLAGLKRLTSTAD